jgi:exonuclease SbcC
MKICLSNFRCYTDRDIETPDSGVLLLSGPSGKGKSTLLNAISFVITGEGKNVSSFGTTKTSVSVDFGGICISRSKRPNRLTLSYPDGTVLEDDVAQSVINKMFGQYFNQSSYIMQGNINTFLYMSPSEKLEFFEDFVFSHLDLSDKKERIKALIKERNTNLTASRSKLETIDTMLMAKKQPEKVSFPIKCQREERADIKAKYERLQKTKRELASKLESDMRTALSIQKANASKREELSRMTARRDYLKEELSSILRELEGLKREDVDHKDEIRRLQTEIEELNRARDMYMSAGSEEDISSMKSELEELKKALWKDETETEAEEAVDGYRQMIADLKRYYTAKEKLDSMDPPVDLNALRSDIHTAELCKKTLACPCCKESLSFDGERLHKLIKLPSMSVSELRSKLKKAESLEAERASYTRDIKEVEETYEEICTIDDANDSMQGFLTYIQENKEISKKIRDIETRIGITEDRNKRIREKRESSLKIFDKYNISADRVSEEVRMRTERVSVLREEERECSRERERRSVLERKREMNERDGEVCERAICGIEMEEEMDMNDINMNLEKCRNDMEKIESILKKMQEFDRYVEEKGLYDSLVRDKERYEREVEKWGELLESIYILKEKIVVAESLYLERTLDELNAKIQENLNMFFVEEPIVVSLETFKPVKGNKETKPQINLQVFYKGVDMDIMSLSGGERDRVNLAIVLSLNSIFNSPMLLLDECISSLDYNNFNRVIESLQENMKDKLVFLVCHQAEEGQFDDVLIL